MLDGGHVSHDVQSTDGKLPVYRERFDTAIAKNHNQQPYLDLIVSTSFFVKLEQKYILSIFIISIGKPSIVASEIIMPLTVNEYFGGNVKSIAFQTKTLPATVGVMVPGEYTFDTSKKEVVTVVSGCLTVQLPDTEEWNEYLPHSSFEVAANKSFNLKVTEDTAYLCTYE